MLGWQRSYPELLEQAMEKGLHNITFETNGTQEIAKEFEEWVYNVWHGYRLWDQLTFSVSAKLPCSGEKWEEAIKPDIVVNYEKLGYTYLKFVVSTEDDVDDVEAVLDVLDVVLVELDDELVDAVELVDEDVLVVGYDYQFVARANDQSARGGTGVRDGQSARAGIHQAVEGQCVGAGANFHGTGPTGVAKRVTRL